MYSHIRLSLATFMLIGMQVAVADHIPGHDDSDPVFPVPIPGKEHFSGGIVFVTAIGPVAGTEITHTRFDITWVSDGATPAADLEIDVEVQVDNVWREVHVFGSDLGFTSGPGTFTGTFETEDLNGIVWQGGPFPHSLVDLSIGARTGGVKGTSYFVDSYIYFDVIPVSQPLLGDMNCNGVVSVSDIGGFVLALTSPAGYAAQYPNCDINNGDVNIDGSVTVGDIGPFVEVLTGI